MTNVTVIPEVTRPKVPLAQAAHMLAKLCDLLDDGADPNDAFVAVFNETKLELAEAIDRRIAFDHWIEGAINAANSARDQWADRAKKLRATREVFKANTQAIIESNPDLPYQGTLGRLAVQRNGQPALKLTFGDKELTPELIGFYNIDPRFIRTTTTYAIDAATVKAAIAAGEKIEWAELETRQHLRIRK